MASESRQLPNSNITRKQALHTANLKNTAMGALSFLTPLTKSRLIAINTSYVAKYDDVFVKKHALVVLTNRKTIYAAAAAMVCSHFVQVFNLGVARGVFTKDDRAFYKLDVNSAHVPEMNTDEQIMQVAADLVKGENDRVTAGGVAMMMPSIDDVTNAATNLTGVYMPHSTAADAYDAALEAVDGLNDEADKVIKKVWDEVETFYNEEEASSQRQNAREWGVIYVAVGSPKIVTGKVLDSVTGAAVAGVTVSFANGTKKSVSDAEGIILLIPP